MRSGLVLPIWSAAVFLMLVAATAVDAQQRSGPQRASFGSLSDEFVDEIESLRSIPYVQAWAESTLAAAESLQETDPNDFATVKSVLTGLQQQSAELQQLMQPVAAHAGTSPEYVALLSQLQRLDYAIKRRLDIWNVALDGVDDSAKRQSDDRPFRAASRGMISFGGLDEQWAEYFALDDIRKEFNSLNPDAKRQQQVARQTLARIYSPVLKPEQAQYARQAFDPAVIDLFRDKASDSPDRSTLLKRIERYEDSPSGLTAYRLNDSYQDYLWSDDRHDQAVADKIHAHYRNANVRLAISGDLLNRMIPTMPTMREPVSEKILGAQVSGRSDISNQLQIELLPDPDHVHLRVQTAGTVHSSTVARRDGFAIQNEGLARFQVFKRLAFGRDGVDASEVPVAWSTAKQRVVGMQSKVDNVPIVGWVARRIASQKIEEQAPRAEQLVRNKVERDATVRMQNEVEDKLMQMRTRMYQNVLQPLLALDLEPEPVEMSTTDREIVMRYRLAGRDQLAANTARPQATPGGLFNIQLHESAVNNAIARIGLNGNEFSADELKAHLREVLGVGQPAAEDEEPGHDATFEFAHFDPLAVRFDDQRVTISLNLKSLQLGEGKKWQKLSVKATYVPRVSGLNIVLQQDDTGIHLKGRRLHFRDQVAVRTVFEVLFQEQYELKALEKRLGKRLDVDSLAMSQLVLTDGWLGLTVADRPAFGQAVQTGNASASFGNRSRRTRR